MTEDKKLTTESEIVEYYKDKEYITTADKVVFPTNKVIYNTIFGQNYKGSYQPSGIDWNKLYTKYGYEEGLVPWIPQETHDVPTKSGYFNIVSQDEICEYSENKKTNMERKFENRYFGQKRVVFVGCKGKGGKFTYTFAGIFVGQGYDEEGKMYYKCIDDKFKIVR